MWCVTCTVQEDIRECVADRVVPWGSDSPHQPKFVHLSHETFLSVQLHSTDSGQQSKSLGEEIEKTHLLSVWMKQRRATELTERRDNILLRFNE